LKKLWALTFPSRPCEVPSEQWKDMGWQGTDPATDFRSGGLLALQNLLYLAEERPQLYHALLHKTQGDRAQDLPLESGGRGGEYPFAAAGVYYGLDLHSWTLLAVAATVVIR
jgi:ELMO domain-containing protein